MRREEGGKERFLDVSTRVANSHTSKKSEFRKGCKIERFYSLRNPSVQKMKRYHRRYNVNDERGLFDPFATSLSRSSLWILGEEQFNGIIALDALRVTRSKSQGTEEEAAKRWAKGYKQEETTARKVLCVMEFGFRF